MATRSLGRLRWKHLAAELAELAWPPPFPVFDSDALQDLGRGDGHAVLVLPASLRDDGQTSGMRALLSGLGYAAYGWDLGVDVGPTARLVRGATERLGALYTEHGPVSLVGFSMGGLFARLLAARYPQLARQVITVCSPIHEPAHSVWVPLEPFLGLWPGVDLRALIREVGAPPSVPSTCIYSRDDGIVRWRHCFDSAGAPEDDFEVSGCHVTMARNAEALRIVAARLARRFEPDPATSRIPS